MAFISSFGLDFPTTTESMISHPRLQVCIRVSIRTLCHFFSFFGDTAKSPQPLENISAMKSLLAVTLISSPWSS